MHATPDATDTISPTWWARHGKRAVDAVAAALLLVVVSPVLLLAAIVVKLTSPGPIMFTQSRAGRHGKPFLIYKFRTMRAERVPDPNELVPLNHTEITKPGWWLRRTKIDELPQLFNVLRGDMAMVGPRPTLPDQAERYDAFRRRRLLVRPGITGLAQVHGNTAIPWDERILFDVAYVRLCSFRLDVQILLRTIGVVLRGEPASPPPFATSRYAASIEVPAGYGDHTSH